VANQLLEAAENTNVICIIFFRLIVHYASKRILHTILRMGTGADCCHFLEMIDSSRPAAPAVRRPGRKGRELLPTQPFDKRSRLSWEK